MLDAAVDADKARDDAITVYEALPPGDTAKPAALDLVNQKTGDATKARKDYVEELAVPRGNMFDLDPAEEFYVSTEYGNLRGPTGSSPKNRVSLDDLNTSALAGAQFTTYEGDRYTWTKGNTYTFGGGNDYSFANGYSVSMSYDAIICEDFNTWDGSFPYDIYAPVKNAGGDDEKPTNRRFWEFETSFDKLPNEYKVKTVLPAGPLFFPAVSDLVKFENNGVSKNIGHTYGYQLGDTHSIQLSKNTSSVTAVDRANSFESTEISESHSHVGIAASFDAHGMDVSLGIKALDIGINVSGVNFGVSIKAADITFDYTLFKFDYSKVQFEYKLVDGDKFDVSKKTQQLNLEKVETIAVDGILLQVDSDPALNKKGKDLLGAADEKGEKWTHVGPDSNAVGPLSAKGKILEIDYNRVVKASTNAKGRADALGQRASFSRVAVDRTSVKLASFSYSIDSVEVMSEFVISSKERQIELNIRDSANALRGNINNTTQMFDLDKGLYYVTHYENENDGFVGKMWVARSADAGKDITANSGGIYVQKAAVNYASLDLDVETNTIDLASHKDADNLVDLQADSNTNKFTLEVKKAADVATLLMDTTTGESKWHAKKGSKEFTIKHKDNLTVSFKDGKESKLVLEKELVKITSKKFVVGVGSNIVAEKAGIKLQSKEVKVGKMTVKDMDVTIPQPKVTIGKSAKIAITAAGLDIKGPKISISGSGVAEIKGAMIKIG